MWVVLLRAHARARCPPRGGPPGRDHGLIDCRWRGQDARHDCGYQDDQRDLQPASLGHRDPLPRWWCHQAWARSEFNCASGYVGTWELARTIRPPEPAHGTPHSAGSLRSRPLWPAIQNAVTLLPTSRRVFCMWPLHPRHRRRSSAVGCPAVYAAPPSTAPPTGRPPRSPRPGRSHSRGCAAPNSSATRSPVGVPRPERGDCRLDAFAVDVDGLQQLPDRTEARVSRTPRPHRATCSNIGHDEYLVVTDEYDIM